jgi:hypothetical protein
MYNIILILVINTIISKLFSLLFYSKTDGNNVLNFYIDVM